MQVTYTNSSIPLRTAGLLIVAACNSAPVLASDEHRFAAGTFFTQGASELGSAYEVIESIDHFSAALGVKGVERLKNLKMLKDGWNGADAKALDERSVELARAFFEAHELAPKNMAVFFTQDGYLSLGWEDAHGLDVEVTFGTAALSAFIEESDEVLSAPVDSEDRVQEIVDRLRETI